MIELANGSMLDAHDLAVGTTGVDFRGFHPVQGVGTTCVGPNTGERNFGAGALCQEHFSFCVKEKKGKGPM